MTSGVAFSRQSYKTRCPRVLGALLCLLLVASPAHALWGKKKNEAESMPPWAPATPTLINPHEGLPAKPKLPTNEETVTPQQLGPTPLPMPDNPTQVLIEQGIFQPDDLNRTEPLTRAELAGIMVRALRHNTQMVSEFPFYRDVPLNSPSYTDIETARAKKLLTYPKDHGFYHPEKLITFADVYTGIGNAVTGTIPTDDDEAIEHYLSRFPEWQSIPNDLQPQLAKMVRARFFERRSRTMLHLDETVTPARLAPFIATLTHLSERKTERMATERATIALQGGLPLTVSPAIAIFESRLSIGEVVYFSLVEPAGPLPKGSKIRGLVKDIINPRTYVIQLVEAQTPDDAYYRMRAELNIEFSPKQKLPFVVPGETFTTTTQVPPLMPVLPTPKTGTARSRLRPNPLEGPTMTMPARPPAASPAPSYSKPAPNSAPHSSK